MANAGVYVCHCGTNISAKVDIAEVARFASSLPGVTVARDYKFMCSDPGQRLIQEDIAGKGIDRVVVASCSPLMHEPTFRAACVSAGLNAHLFQMANIREHCSWVTEDPEAATQKAKALVAAAVAKADKLEALERKTVPVGQEALVVGGGIAGIQAALDIAESGRTVTLVERDTSIGGHMAKFDKTFPTLDCAACILTPRMVQVGHHEKIRLITGAEVEECAGHVGSFRVRIRQRPRYVNVDLCKGCGECAEVCPVEVKNDFEEGLSVRKAVYRNFPQAVPGAFAIEREPAPCKVTCPIGQDVQGYLVLAAAGKIGEAYDLIRRTNPLPGVCGRVCYHRCEDACNRRFVDEPLAARAIKRFITETAADGRVPDRPPKSGKKVAIVGSGPTGLAAAHDLALWGHEVQILEGHPEPGGMLRAGIPRYRLPRDVLDADIGFIRKLGVAIHCGRRVSPSDLSGLLRENDAVLLATGAHEGLDLSIPGEDLDGVFTGVDFLREVNFGRPPRVGSRVAVIGGGNTAMDAARTAIRLGAQQVRVLYRRSRNEMPASAEEIQALEEEGITIEFLVSPTRVVAADGKVAGVELQKMRLGDPDESGRRRPLPIPESEFVEPCDMLIPAVSQRPESALAREAGCEVSTWGALVADPLTMATAVPKLFSGGDAVRGPASVVEAMADGKRAARAMHNLLAHRPIEDGLEPPAGPIRVSEEEKLTFRLGHAPAKRVVPPHLPARERVGGFEEVEQVLSQEEVIQEASRCMDCGVCSGCRQCAEACEAGAIDYEMPEQRIDLDVGAVILTTGFQTFDARRVAQYGYGKMKNVLSALEFERMSSASGPTGGRIRLDDGSTPKSVGLIHCVGSRNENYNRHCSRVCCMYALKFTHLIKEKTAAEVYSFYIDMRCFGKGYEEFYLRLLEEGVRFVRGRVGYVMDMPLDETEAGKLVIRAEDTLLGQVRRVPVDMVVLCTGLEPASGADEIARVFRISRSQDGFFLEKHPKLAPVSTATDGIFVAGACQGPKDIPDVVGQASGAAAQVLSMMGRGEIEVEAATCTVDADRCSGCRVCNTLCPMGAIDFDEESKKTSISDVLCKGCGTCAAACPSAAIVARHFTDAQVSAEIEGALYDVRA